MKTIGTKCLLLGLACCLLLAGCGPKQPQPSDTPTDPPRPSPTETAVPTPAGTEVRLAVISGPTGVGAAKLMADHDADAQNSAIASYEIVTDNTQVQTALVNKDVDVAAIATNAAAALCAKTDGGIQVLAVNTLGVLYILEKGDTVHSMADLAGKTLYAPSNTKGANPEHILNHLLEGSGVAPADVTIEWLTPQEITAKMSSSDAGICMLPVPAATALLVKDSGVREAISLSDAWQDLEGSPLPMGCVVARTEYIQENPQEVEAFLAAYEASIDYISDPANSAGAAALVAQYEFAPNDKVAAKAIPQCSLTFVTGQEMKTTLEDYYTILFQVEPKSIGGGLPYDSFYYGVD